MQAVIRVSESYMYVFGTVLSVYFFPRIAAKASYVAQLKLFMALVAVAMLALYLLRQEVISLLFNSNYIAFSETLGVFLFADFLRLFMFVLNLLLISYSRYGDYLAAELAFFIAMVTLTFAATRLDGISSGEIKSFGFIYLLANFVGCLTAYMKFRRIGLA